MLLTLFKEKYIQVSLISLFLFVATVCEVKAEEASKKASPYVIHLFDRGDYKEVEKVIQEGADLSVTDSGNETLEIKIRDRIDYLNEEIKFNEAKPITAMTDGDLIDPKDSQARRSAIIYAKTKIAELENLLSLIDSRKQTGTGQNAKVSEKAETARTSTKAPAPTTQQSASKEIVIRALRPMID